MVFSTHRAMCRSQRFLGKPYRPEDVVRALKIVESIVVTDLESPQGFSLLRAPLKADKAAVFTDAELAQQIRRLRRQHEELAKFGTFALSCTIYQYRPEESDMLAVAGFGWSEGVIGRVTSQADASSPQGRAWINLAPVVCDALRNDGTVVLPSHYTEYGIVSTLDVVIWDDCQPVRRPYGVLELDSPIQNENYGAFYIDSVTA